MSIARGRNIALAAVIFLASIEPVVSEPLDEATAALRRGDYVTALRIMRPFAEQGDRRAQFNFGVSFEQGWGVNRDDTEAAKWYRLAAEQGYSLAQHNLAELYANGRGVQQDLAEALKWYRLAGAQGNAFS